MEYKIIHLPKEKWKGHTIPIKYTTNEYYDVEIKNICGFHVDFKNILYYLLSISRKKTYQ